jgi:flagellar secretion chaperone FliS
MYADPRAHYQAQSVETAGPAQLVLMLYDRVLLALDRSERACAPATRDVALAGHELQRAQDIVWELRLTLDAERGGALAADLGGLYAFCLERLVEANLRKDGSGIPDVRAVVADLRDAWDVACVRSAVGAGAR